MELVNNIKHRIIIDTDTAGDDALAIAMLAKASNITIEGITVLPGNVPLEQGTKNALMVLEKAGRTDIPVYCGADTTIDGIHRECFSVFGEDGMGDMDLIHPTFTATDGDGVDFILDTIKKYPNEIEIFAIGPATNIAKAIQKAPETMKQVKMVWSMGTTGFGNGNATPVAEFNVYSDVQAYKIMMDFDIPVTIIGLDMCESRGVVYKRQYMNELSKSSELGDFLQKSWNKLFQFTQNNQQCDVSNVELLICDAVAAATLIWDNFIASSINCASYVCIEETPAFGQVIFYKEKFVYDSMPHFDKYDKRVVTQLNDDYYRKEIENLLK